MKNTGRCLIVAISIGALAAFAPAWAQDDDTETAAKNVSQAAYFKRYEVAGDQFQVRLDLESTLESRGLEVSDVRNIFVPGVTDADPPYLSGEFVSFCGAPLVDLWLNSSAHDVILCPVTIAVYVLPRQSETVHVSYRSMGAQGGSVKSLNASAAMGRLLDEIMEDLAEP